MSLIKEDKLANKVGTVIYKDCVIDYGLGGVHGVCNSGLYESDNEYIIKSLDVASLYPNLPIVYKFYIEHLGKEFLEVYENDIVNIRMAEKNKPKNEQDLAIIDGFKEGANIPYGKSNDINSFLYDPLYTMKTTVAGQLITSVLCERLGQIPECKILAYNTDGMEILIPRKYENLYKDICKQWEKDTKLTLEFVDYQKMWIADINNYGCIAVNGKIKNKGRFEVDKVIGNEPAYYKDNSFKIVPLALCNYFSKGIPVEKTIMEHRNIYDFCGRQKFSKESYGMIHYIDNQKVDIKQQKNTRYYISNNGSVFLKYYSKGTIEAINKGYLVIIFNNFIDKQWNNYNINYRFYISECYKEINLIESKQLTLWN